MKLEFLYQRFYNVLEGNVDPDVDPGRLFFYAGAVLTYETWIDEIKEMKRQGIEKKKITELLNAQQEQMVTDCYKYFADYLRDFHPNRLKNH